MAVGGDPAFDSCATPATAPGRAFASARWPRSQRPCSSPPGSRWWQLRGPSQALAESDAILLADFGNTTGDAVFDGTLKQALAVKLEESPFLNVVSDQRVRETLAYMNRPADTPVTAPVAREICQRQGIKASLLGDIASLGIIFVVTLTRRKLPDRRRAGAGTGHGGRQGPGADGIGHRGHVDAPETRRVAGVDRQE